MARKIGELIDFDELKKGDKLAYHSWEEWEREKSAYMFLEYFTDRHDVPCMRLLDSSGNPMTYAITTFRTGEWVYHSLGGPGPKKGFGKFIERQNELSLAS